jgi:hypothetical protein
MLSQSDIFQIVKNEVKAKQFVKFGGIADILFCELYSMGEITESFDLFDEVIKIAEDKLTSLCYVKEDHSSLFVYVPRCDGKNWLDLNMVGKNIYKQMPVKEIVNNLESRDYELFQDNDYHPHRLLKINESLDLGTNPQTFSPIRLSYYMKPGYFSITDGIHRLKSFYQRDIDYINSCISISK